MARLLNIFGWVLIGMAALIIAYTLFAASSMLEALTNALPVGILVALAAQLFSQSKSAKEVQEKRSLFYLESSVKAFDEARNLLKDGNNERVIWIAAARALGHAQELSKGVTEDAHKRVLELHRLEYRGFFGALLSDKPASFFYGAADLSVTLEEAAKQSSAGETRNGRRLVSGVRDLSDKALRAVWEAAQWPEDYQDPLQAGFSPEETAKCLVLYPGLHEFLEHKSEWHSVAGKLYPRQKRDVG
jgi:hypothetical protein